MLKIGSISSALPNVCKLISIRANHENSSSGGGAVGVVLLLLAISNGCRGPEMQKLAPRLEISKRAHLRLPSEALLVAFKDIIALNLVQIVIGPSRMVGSDRQVQHQHVRVPTIRFHPDNVPMFSSNIRSDAMPKISGDCVLAIGNGDTWMRPPHRDVDGLPVEHLGDLVVDDLLYAGPTRRDVAFCVRANLCHHGIQLREGTMEVFEFQPQLTLGYVLVIVKLAISEVFK